MRKVSGPDFAMVTRNSLMLSRRAGILTAVGIGGGILVHVSYTLIGIGLIMQQSLWLFNMIKLIGAALKAYHIKKPAHIEQVQVRISV